MEYRVNESANVLKFNCTKIFDYEKIFDIPDILQIERSYV